LPAAELKPEPSWRALYPFASHFLPLEGGRYHYLDEGQGPTLLLVHGNPTWSFHWRNLILALRSRCRLIAVDHIGCGLSDKPARYPYRLKQHVDNLCRLITALDLRDVTLVAQDWGGAIGLGAVLHERQRFSRLVLSNTGAFRVRRMPWRIRICRTPFLGPLMVRGLNGFARGALRMAVAHPERLTPAVRSGYLAPYDNWAHRIAIDRFVRDIPMHPRQPSYATLLEIEHGLPSLADLPTRLIWGMQDWCFTPYFLKRFLEFWPHADAHRLPGAGHWAIEDATETVIRLIDQFVGQTSSTSAESR
jgi:cis-3-alkyl-4-acyloxetan-2-one decarboxylase